MSLVSPFIVVVPTSDAGYNFDYGLFDAEATATVVMAPTAQSDVINLSDMPTGGLWMKAHLQQLHALPDVTDVEKLSKRLVPMVSLVMSTPAVVGGRPTHARYYGQNDATANLTQHDSHLGVTADPDPVWDGGTSTWLVDPPAGGVGDYRWTVRDLTEPIDGRYALSTWHGNPGTPGTPDWISKDPFKPDVISYTHRNQDGTSFHVDAAIRFSPHDVQHMWTTFTSLKELPFSWIIVALILDNKTTNYQHFLLDQGYDATAQGGTFTTPGDYGQLPGRYEGLGDMRTMMTVDRHRQFMTNDRSSHRIHCHHPLHAHPRMYYGIWNGSNSYVGSASNNYSTLFKGSTTNWPTMTGSYMIGRENGWVHADHGASMLMFEMRYFNHALDYTVLLAQYKQLATTWKFSRFK